MVFNYNYIRLNLNFKIITRNCYEYKIWLIKYFHFLVQFLCLVLIRTVINFLKETSKIITSANCGVISCMSTLVFLEQLCNKIYLSGYKKPARI